MDSDVIVSEYRLLFLKYREQIDKYKSAIADLSLRQIIADEEEAWLRHKQNADSATVLGKVDLKREVSGMSSDDFDKEIHELTKTLKEKVASLRKDYKELKVFQNEMDIATAREKLMVFLRRLINDTNALLT